MIRVIIAGDFAPAKRLNDQICNQRYNEIFDQKLIDLVKNADYSIVNLECPIEGKDQKPIPKMGPNLCCSPNVVKAISYAGFKAVTLANNHIMDYGQQGLQKTINGCNSMGLAYVGVGNDLKDAGRILYTEKNGEKLAIINCCEHEFSVALDNVPGANPLNPVQQFYAVKEARKNADYVLVIVHGGHEHFQLPSSRMQELYRFFVDAGADAIVNHHQHCYSGYELYNGHPIFYGLGNFGFDGNRNHGNSIWNEGFMASITFDKDAVSYDTHPYRQYSDNEPSIKLVEHIDFEQKISQLNSIIADPDKLKREVDNYYCDSGRQMKSVLEPVQNKIVRHLQFRGLFPSMLTKQWAIKLKNYISCESHRDKLLHYLNNYIGN